MGRCPAAPTAPAPSDQLETAKQQSYQAQASVCPTHAPSLEPAGNGEIVPVSGPTVGLSHTSGGVVPHTLRAQKSHRNAGGRLRSKEAHACDSQGGRWIRFTSTSCQTSLVVSPPRKDLRPPGPAPGADRVRDPGGTWSGSSRPPRGPCVCAIQLHVENHFKNL